jgi:hypothetical protein
MTVIYALNGQTSPDAVVRYVRERRQGHRRSPWRPWRRLFSRIISSTNAQPIFLRSASAGVGRSQKVILRFGLGFGHFYPVKDGNLRDKG